MPFLKYPEIENHYRTKEVQYVLDKFPHMENEQYILQEKLDGSCVSLVFSKDGKLTPAKRSGVIHENENFYDIWNVLHNQYSEGVIYLLSDYAKSIKSELNVYGELFGKGIQRRINYGNEKCVRFFDLRIDDVMMSPVEMEDIFRSLNIEDMLVPNFGVVKGLNKALEFDVEDKMTLLNPEGGDLIEGIVIKPYNGMFQVDGGIFYLKKKREKFKESKPKKEIAPVDSKLEYLQSSFRDYITENRVLGIFSKYGEIEKPTQIGEYIKHVLEDAKNDFLKDYGDEMSDLDKKDMKYVYNVSKDVVKLLEKHL
jgi:Rnl2 family RNA ligase